MELDEYLPALRTDRRAVRRRRGRRRCWPTAGRRTSPAAPAGGWPTWCGTWPRCSTSGPGSCGRGRTDPSAYPEPDRSTPTTSCSATWPAQHAELETALAARRSGRAGLDLGAPAGRRPSCCAGRSTRRSCTPSTSSRCSGDVRPIPPDIGLDGLDEWLEVMVPGAFPDGPPARRAPRRLPRRGRRRRADPLPRHPALPDRRPDRATPATCCSTVWRRLPLEVLTVDGDRLQAAAMIDLVRIE